MHYKWVYRKNTIEFVHGNHGNVYNIYTSIKYRSVEGNTSGILSVGPSNMSTIATPGSLYHAGLPSRTHASRILQSFSTGLRVGEAITDTVVLDLE